MTEASKYALIELANHLKLYHNDIVLIGGWAPYFITQGYFPHNGSQDIDLVIRTEIPIQQDSIYDILRRLRYSVSRFNKYQFLKKVVSPDNDWTYQVKLEFLCEKDGIELTGGTREVQKGLRAHAFEGMSIAFDFNYEEALRLGDFASATNVTFKVVDLVGCLALKGESHPKRFEVDKQQKDAYDIFALTYYNGGISQASEYFNQTISGKKIPLKNQELLKRSLAYISKIFSDKNQKGSYHVELFAPEHNSSIVAARMNKFLNDLNLDF